MQKAKKQKKAYNFVRQLKIQKDLLLIDDLLIKESDKEWAQNLYKRLGDLAGAYWCK